MADKNSVTGLKKNTAAALAYVLLQVSGIVFLFLEKDPFVRFHAMQSIVVFTILMAFQWVLDFTHIFANASALVGVVGFALWLVLIYKAWMGEEFDLPVVGKIARQLVKKV